MERDTQRRLGGWLGNLLLIASVGGCGLFWTSQGGDDQSVSLFVLNECLFDAFAMRNILDVRQEVGRRSVFIAHQRTVDVGPDDLPIFADVALLAFERMSLAIEQSLNLNRICGTISFVSHISTATCVKLRF